MKRMKVSREGILLIKSFEGFRPSAVQHGEGWIIGYGHTRSAREGASVTEADAELLLHYDLISVADAINGHISTPLNQHQFDALASFALSVGVDRFGASDVLAQLQAGSTTEAAEAMAGWPDPASLSFPIRRRAERALFVSDPDAAFTLPQLLTAPLSPAEPASSPETTGHTAVLPETAGTATASVTTAIVPETDVPPTTDAPTDDMGQFASAGSAFAATEPLNRFAAYAGDATENLAGPSPISATTEPEGSGTLVVVPPAIVEETPMEAEGADPASEESEALAIDRSRALRRDRHAARPLRLSWRKTGSYLIMGIFGLATFGLSVVSFRKAWLDQTSDSYLLMGAVLAVLGLACVVISAWNLYRKADPAQGRTPPRSYL